MVAALAYSYVFVPLFKYVCIIGSVIKMISSEEISQLFLCIIYLVVLYIIMVDFH